MELSPLSYEGDQQQDDDQGKDKKRRFNPINPVTKKAVSGWLNPSETFSKSPPPEHRMPAGNVVAPENSNEQPRTVSREDAFHSDAWFGGEVRPPEYQSIAALATRETPVTQPMPPAVEAPAPSQPVEDDAFQRLLERAGLDDLANSLEHPQEAETPEPHNEAELSTKPKIEGSDNAPASPVEQQDTNRSEYILRSQARTRALISYAAGLIIGNRSNKDKVRHELTRALEQIPDEATKQNVEDPFNLQPEEHVERDAWHSIVVDKYGREDVNARLQYGKAFRQEQREVQQSALSDDTPTTSNDGTQPVSAAPSSAQDAAGTQATPGPMLAGPVSQPRLSLPTNIMPSISDGLTEPQLPTGPLVTKDPQHLLPAHSKAGVFVLLNPWVWLVAGLLILVFFAASLIG
jgi:hypothetical protein